MTDDLRARLARALADHAQQDRGLDADRYGPENWLCCADAVMAVIGEQQRAYEDLLGAVSLHVDWRFVTKQLTTEQKNLWADAHDAWSSRMDPDEPSKADRWWAR